MSDDITELRDELTEQFMNEGVLTFFQHDGESVVHHGLPWAYTVGRTLSGRPELLVTGLDATDSIALLLELADVDAQPDTPPLTTCVGTVLFIPAETGLLHATYCVFGANFTVLQVVWTGDGPQPLHPAGGLILTDPYPD